MGRPFLGWFEVREAMGRLGALERLSETQARYMRGYFDGPPGVTMQAVADACGVSRSDVSRVIHNGCDALVRAGYLAPGVV